MAAACLLACYVLELLCFVHSQHSHLDGQGLDCLCHRALQDFAQVLAEGISELCLPGCCSCGLLGCFFCHVAVLIGCIDSAAAAVKSAD